MEAWVTIDGTSEVTWYLTYGRSMDCGTGTGTGSSEGGNSNYCF